MAAHAAGKARQQAGTGGVPPGGTMGGKPHGLGLRPGARPGSLQLGDAGYLWVLVAIEVFAMGCLRHGFRRYHGG